MEPKISYTNVKSFDFNEKIKEVKKDNKDSLLAVDKDTGNVTIYTFDEKIPSEFKKGLAMTQLVFEDLGEDDANAETPEINKFIHGVKRAGSKLEPEEFLNRISNKIPAFKNELNEKVNNWNIRDSINNQLDKFSDALKNKDIPEIEKWSAILTNTTKQIFFDTYYVPNDGIMSLGRVEYQLANDLRVITRTTDITLKLLKDDQIKTGLKEVKSVD